MTNPTLSITDVIRQSLAFLSKHDLSKDKNTASTNQPFTGLIIGNDTQSVFSQIQAIDEAIDQAVSWEAFDYQEFIAHRFAKRYDKSFSAVATCLPSIVWWCKTYPSQQQVWMWRALALADYMSGRLWSMTKVIMQPATKYGNLICLTINICQIGLIASFGQILNYGINFVGSGFRQKFKYHFFRNYCFRQLVLLSLIL